MMIKLEKAKSVVELTANVFDAVKSGRPGAVCCTFSFSRVVEEQSQREVTCAPFFYLRTRFCSCCCTTVCVKVCYLVLLYLYSFLPFFSQREKRERASSLLFLLCRNVLLFDFFFVLLSPFVGLTASRQQRIAKVRTPLQLYVRHLMMEKLRDDPAVVEEVIKLLRKLPWQVGERPRGSVFCLASSMDSRVRCCMRSGLLACSWNRLLLRCCSCRCCYCCCMLFVVVISNRRSCRRF